MSLSIDLSNRLKNLREQTAAETSEFPLWALLIIYEKANRSCYINYMAGARALVNWLSPVVSFDVPKYPIPEVLGSYETQQLADILDISEEIIIHTTITQVIPKMREQL